MKENLEEMNQRGVAARWPVLLGGAAPDPRLRRGRPGLPLRGRGPVRPRRVRRPPTHGRRGVGEARPQDVAGGRASRAAQAASVARVQGRRTGSRVTTNAPTWPPTTRCRRRRSGAAASFAACIWPTMRPTSTSGRRFWASGGCAGPEVARRTRIWSRRRAGPGCGCGWTVCTPRHPGSCRRVRVLARGLRRQRPACFRR